MKIGIKSLKGGYDLPGIPFNLGQKQVITFRLLLRSDGFQHRGSREIRNAVTVDNDGVAGQVMDFDLLSVAVVKKILIIRTRCPTGEPL